MLGETWTILDRRGGHGAAVGFLERLGRLPNVDLAHVDDTLEADAWRWLRRHDEREYFTAAGFIEVRPS